MTRLPKVVYCRLKRVTWKGAESGRDDNGTKGMEMMVAGLFIDLPRIFFGSLIRVELICRCVMPTDGR
jgi:hypothetical protein